MIVQNAVKVVITADVVRDPIRIQEILGATCRSRAGGSIVQGTTKGNQLSGNLAVHPVVHINGMAGIKLEEATKRPAAQSMTYKALFRFQEGQLVGYIELKRIGMVFRARAIVPSRVGIRDVVIG